MDSAQARTKAAGGWYDRKSARQFRRRLRRNHRELMAAIANLARRDAAKRGSS